MRNFFWNIYTKNCLAAGLILVALVMVVLLGLNFYTRHGQQVSVPDTKGMQVAEAVALLQDRELSYLVVDSIFVKNKAPGSILETVPPAGTHVKRGRTIYLTINAGTAQHITVPSVTDMSQRQARALLASLGFEEVSVREVPGPYPDLVVGLTDQRGHIIQAGQRLPVDAQLILLVNTGEVIDSFPNGTERPAVANDADELWY